MDLILKDDMYKRFLNSNDYLGIATSETFVQMARGNTEHFIQTEEAAKQLLPIKNSWILFLSDYATLIKLKKHKIDNVYNVLI